MKCSVRDWVGATGVCRMVLDHALREDLCEWAPLVWEYLEVEGGEDALAWSRSLSRSLLKLGVPDVTRFLMDWFGIRLVVRVKEATFHRGHYVPSLYFGAEDIPFFDTGPIGVNPHYPSHTRQGAELVGANLAEVSGFYQCGAVRKGVTVDWFDKHLKGCRNPCFPHGKAPFGRLG